MKNLSDFLDRFFVVMYDSELYIQQSCRFKDGYLSFTVADSTVHDEVYGFGKRNFLNIEKFVGIEILSAELQAFCEVNVSDFRVVRRRGEHFAEVYHFIADIAGLLSKLTFSAFKMIFTPFELAGGNFHCNGLKRIAELLYKEYFVIVCYGYNAYSAVVPEYVTDSGIAVLQHGSVVGNSKNFTLEYHFAFHSFFIEMHLFFLLILDLFGN